MRKTKVIRVFIAASENLAEVKAAVCDLLNQLNRCFLPRGIEFVPTLPTEGATDGDLALVLYWKDFGDLPKAEFEQAYEVFKKEAQPRIYVFFREPAPDALDALKAFRDSFATKYGHFYCHFETLDSVKFQMTVQSLALLPDAVAQDALKVDGEKVVMGNATVASLENLPFAKLNSRRRTLQRQVIKAAQEVEELEAEVNATPDDEDLKDALRQAQVAHNALREELRQHDGFLFGLALHIAKESTKKMDERVRKARELFEQGKAREANQLLALPEMETQANRNLELFQANREACEKDIQAFAAKARLVLVDDSLTMAKRIEEACRSYDNAIRVARGIRLDGDRFATILFDYGILLMNQKRFRPAIERLSESLAIRRALSDSNPDTYNSSIVAALNNLAILHQQTNQFAVAEREYNEALDISRKLVEAKGDAYEPFMAQTLNNLANLHRINNCSANAEQEFGQALEICRRLATMCPDMYEPKVAGILNNLALIHGTMKLEEAFKEFEEALGIYSRLADANPDTYESRFADTLYNLALLHSRINRHEEAELVYGAALEIYRRLAKQNPDAYECYVAKLLNDFALSCCNMRRLETAEGFYNEALSIWRRLAGEYPETYAVDMAKTLYDLAYLHRVSQQCSDAEVEYLEALATVRRLMNGESGEHKEYEAMILNDLSVMHAAAHRFEEAESECAQALEIRRKMQVVAPDVYTESVVKTLLNYVIFLVKNGKQQEALAAAEEAEELCERHSGKFGGPLEQAKRFIEALRNQI